MLVLEGAVEASVKKELDIVTFAARTYEKTKRVRGGQRTKKAASEGSRVDTMRARPKWITETNVQEQKSGSQADMEEKQCRRPGGLP
jgi:hypothetical protein